MGYFNYGIPMYSNPLFKLFGPLGYMFPIMDIPYRPYRDYYFGQPLFGNYTMQQDSSYYSKDYSRDYRSTDYSKYKVSSYRPYRNSSSTSKYYTKSYTNNEESVKKSTNVVPNESKNGTCRPKAGKNLGKEFLEAVKGVAERVQCDYRDLLAVMNAESGLNPAAVNKKGGATGLIQFMPKTAIGYGTTTEELKNMSAIEQLPYVEEFLKRSKKSAGFKSDEYLSGGDLYALIFLPARAKRDVLCVQSEVYYKWNSRTDLNKNGKIEKFELQQRIESKRVDESIFT